MVTNERTNERQPGEPSASLLLTSMRRQSFATDAQKTYELAGIYFLPRSESIARGDLTWIDLGNGN